MGDLLIGKLERLESTYSFHRPEEGRWTCSACWYACRSWEGDEKGGTRNGGGKNVPADYLAAGKIYDAEVGGALKFSGCLDSEISVGAPV